MSGWTWALLLLLVVVVWFRLRMNTGPDTLSGDEMKKALKETKGRLVDVREPHEYRQGAISGARNIPLGKLEEKVRNWDKEQPVYLYCRSGNRSYTALRKMRHLGFQHVYHLRGGIRAWPDHTR